MPATDSVDTALRALAHADSVPAVVRELPSCIAACGLPTTPPSGGWWGAPFPAPATP